MTLLEPHLDVEQLSAAVDGTRDPAVAAHMLVCLGCRQQVDTWRQTLAPLRALPVLPAGADPVAAAMVAWSPVHGDDVGAEPAGAQPAGAQPAGAQPAGAQPAGAQPAGAQPVGAQPVGAQPAVMAPSGTERSEAAPLGVTSRAPAPVGAISEALDAMPPRRHRNARLRRLQPPAGVAAALVAVVLVAAAVIGIRAGGSGPSSGASKSSSGAVARKSAAPARSTPAPAALGLDPSSGSVSAPVAAPAPVASSAAATGPSPSFTGTAQLATELRHVMSARPAASVKANTPCWHQARLDAAKVPAVTTTSPTFTETVTLVGVPGQVFVFALTHGLVAVVVRSSTCSLLATVSF
jgi:hypothetical protein